MLSRLVLGCGTTGHSVVDSLAGREGDLFVLDPDGERVETLRNEKIAAETADVTDPDAVRDINRPVDVVVVAGDNPVQNVGAATAAREAYPDAALVVYAGLDATADQRDRLRELASTVVLPGVALVDHVIASLTKGDDTRGRALRETLENVEEPLGVFMHDNPDPDAIAAAVALTRIAESLGVEAMPCYSGEISHQENRAFVNLLELDLNQYDEPDPDEFGSIALVDHSRPGVNDQLPPETPVDVVIDHHPPKEEVHATFVDLRDSVGATSTLVTGYLRGFDVDFDESVATGLLYGIRVDTKDFSREITEDDFEEAAFLLPYADTDVLERIESPSMSVDTLDTIARAIRNRKIHGSTLASCVGAIADRDALAQAADRLLTMEGVTTTMVYGFNDGTIYVSARSSDTSLDIGEVLRLAYSEMGGAGGHADMAGAQLPLGVFDEVEEEAEETLTRIVENVMTGRLFEVLHPGAERPTTFGDLGSEQEPVDVVPGEADDEAVAAGDEAGDDALVEGDEEEEPVEGPDDDGEEGGGTTAEAGDDDQRDGDGEAAIDEDDETTADGAASDGDDETTADGAASDGDDETTADGEASNGDDETTADGEASDGDGDGTDEEPAGDGPGDDRDVDDTGPVETASEADEETVEE